MPSVLRLFQKPQTMLAVEQSDLSQWSLFEQGTVCLKNSLVKLYF